MTSILKVDTIQDADGNNIINESGNTITIGASGDTTNIIGTLQNDGAAVGGLAIADKFRLSAAYSAPSNADITSNWERIDTAGQGTLGSAITESSGIFSFPETGIYEVSFFLSASGSDDSRYVAIQINHSSNSGGAYTEVALGRGNLPYIDSTTTYSLVGPISTYLDITDTSTHRVKFNVQFNVTSTNNVQGSTTADLTYVTFKKLGNT